MSNEAKGQKTEDRGQRTTATPVLRPLFSVLCLLFSVLSALAQGPASAVVRIPSHGISGTVIYSGQGKSLILTCAHGFGEDHPDYALLRKPITLDVPSMSKQDKQVGVTLKYISWQWDLSLIEVNTQLPYYCPIAAKGSTPSNNVHSIGYDSMKIPPQDVPAHLVPKDERSKTWTYERPRPGRSGGGLIDMNNARLIGVCHGYLIGNVDGVNSPGVYISLSAIYSFLENPTPPPTQQARPRSKPGVRVYEGPYQQPPGCLPGRG